MLNPTNPPQSQIFFPQSQQPQPQCTEVPTHPIIFTCATRLTVEDLLPPMPPTAPPQSFQRLPVEIRHHIWKEIVDVYHAEIAAMTPHHKHGPQIFFPLRKRFPYIPAIMLAMLENKSLLYFEILAILLSNSIIRIDTKGDDGDHARLKFVNCPKYMLEPIKSVLFAVGACPRKFTDEYVAQTSS